jgi:hypothetical protein
VASWLVIDEELPAEPALHPASDAYPQKAKANIDILPIVLLLVIVVLRTAVFEIVTRNTRVSARASSRARPRPSGPRLTRPSRGIAEDLDRAHQSARPRSTAVLFDSRKRLFDFRAHPTVGASRAG